MRLIPISIVAAFATITVAAPPPNQDENAALQKRTTSTCAAQPAGFGPQTNPDTASAFLSNPVLASRASAATTPAGYLQTFKNLHASTQTNYYMGYTTLKSYDVGLCASKCNAIQGCGAINIYYERDPTVDPGPRCSNPRSTNNIKCVFYGSVVSAENARNYGQYRNKFQVVIAGSNGYVNSKIVSSAKSIITASTLQPFCSSVLGYRPLTTTVTVSARTTPVSLLTRTSTSVIRDSTTSTMTSLVTAVITATRTDITTDTEVSTIFQKREASEASTELRPVSTLANGRVIKLPPTTTAELAGRALQTPPSLTSFPGVVITAACSAAVPSPTKASTTKTISTTITALPSTSTRSVITSTSTTEVIVESLTLTTIQTTTEATLTTVSTTSTTTLPRASRAALSGPPCGTSIETTDDPTYGINTLFVRCNRQIVPESVHLLYTVPSITLSECGSNCNSNPYCLIIQYDVDNGDCTLYQLQGDPVVIVANGLIAAEVNYYGTIVQDVA